MAHLEGYIKTTACAMLDHYSNEKVRAKEKHINHEMTQYNYNLMERDFEFTKETETNKKRLNYILSRDFIKCQNRADVNVMCDWLITLPKNVTLSDKDKFFNIVYDFMKGEMTHTCAIVDAQVHLDETTPHLHFAFVPLMEANAKQKEKGYKYKVCKKDYSTKEYLLDFHKRLNKACSDGLGYDAGIINGKMKEQGYNKTIDELKAETREQEQIKVERLKKENEMNKIISDNNLDIEYRQSKLNKDEVIVKEQDLIKFANSYKTMEDMNKTLVQRENEYKAENSRLNKLVDYLRQDIKNILKMPFKRFEQEKQAYLDSFDSQIDKIADMKEFEVQKREIKEKYKKEHQHEIQQQHIYKPKDDIEFEF